MSAAWAESADVQLDRVFAPTDNAALSEMAGVWIDRGGVIYFTERGNGTLVRVEGDTLSSKNIAGREQQVFRSKKVGGLARLDDKYFVVVNTGDDVAVVVDESGKRQFALGEAGDNDGQLKNPVGVTVSPRQRIYIADGSNHRVSVFSHDGVFLFNLGQAMAPDNSLRRPTQVAVDGQERIYVLESQGNGRVSIYDHHGALLKRFSAESLKSGDRATELAALAVDEAGRLYLADKANGKILQVDWADGRIVQAFGSKGENRGQYSDIVGLAISSDDQLAIADRGNRKIEVYRLPLATGAKRESLRLPGVQRGNPWPAACERANALSESEFLCLDRERRSVNRIARDGKVLASLGGSFRRPSAAAADAKQVAVIDDDQIKLYGLDGKPHFTIGRGGVRDGEFDDAGGVFLRDKLYVADTGNRRVQIFTRDGVFIDKLVNGKDQPPLFEKPVAVAVDSQRNIYVADGGLNRVRVFSPGKELLYELNGGENPVDRFEKIHDLAIDRDDNLYVLAATSRNRYGVRVYSGPRLVFSFGAYSEQARDFVAPTAISLASSERTTVAVYDAKRQALLTYRYLQVPSAVGGLLVRGGMKETRLRWQKAPGNFVDRYRVYGATELDAPFDKILETKSNSITLDPDKTQHYLYYRIAAVSALDVEGELSQTREDLFLAGYRLYQQKKYEAAGGLFARAYRDATGHAEALEYLGRAELERSNFDVAVAHFQELARLPEYETAGLNLEAEAQMRAKQTLAARAVLERAMGKRVADAHTYFLCGQVNLQLGDMIGASGCLEKSLKLDIKNSAAHFLLGQAYVKLGAVEKGLMEFDAAVNFAPDANAMQLRSAQAYQALSRHREALTRFNHVLAADSQNAEARLGAAQCYIALKDYEKARSIALPMAGDPDQEGAGHYLLGTIALAQHKTQDAVLSLAKAAHKDPQNTAVNLVLAEAYVELKDDDKALAALQQAVAAAPESFEGHWRLGHLQQRLMRHAEAAASLAKAVELQPNHYEARYALAASLFTLERYTDAGAQAREAMRLAPKLLEPVVLMADVANRQGKNGDAIDYLKKALALKPESPVLHLKLGRCYLENNVYDQAQAHLEKAVLLDTKGDNAHVLLGEMYLERRLYDPAIKAFTKAAELNPSEANKLQLNAAYAEKKKSQEFKAYTPRVALEDLKLKRVFAATYKQYAAEPVGTIRLKNLSQSDYGNLKISFYVKGYMDFPDVRDVPPLKANGVLEIPVYAAFTNKVLSLDEDTRVQAEVKLIYFFEGRQDSLDITQSMTLYSKNAVLWADANMVGSFVTPKEETLKGFVRQVINQYVDESGPLNKNLIQAMTVFNAASAYGLKYQVDPNSPYSKVKAERVDYVQFPRETLRLRSGDCDDLSVFLASALENLGIETAFVDVPGHLFMMFNTGLAEKDRDSISLQEDLTVIRDGQVWIPLEATMIATSFSESWNEGARKYYEMEKAKTLRVIPVKAAWEQYVPVTLAPASYTIEAPSGERVRRLVDREYRVLLTKHLERLVLPYRAMLMNDPNDQAAMLQIGLIYAKNGLNDLAIQTLDRVLEMNSKSSAAHNNRGNIYYNSGEYDRALDAYRYAEVLDPTDGGIKLNLALTYYKLGKVSEAQAKYRDAVALQKGLTERYRAFEKLLVN